MSLFPPLPPRDGRPRVVVDLRMVRGRLHGIARYALELARRLPALAEDLAFVGLTGPEGLPENLGPLTPDLPCVPCAAGFLTPLEQPALFASLARLSPALFHATSFSLPALWPGRLIATLHDANHLVLRDHYGRSQLAYYRAVVGPTARRARALITVSEFSRQEIARELNLSPYALQVIHNGVDAPFRPATATERQRLRAELALPPRYFLLVGNEKPHKNLALISRIASRLPAPVVLVAGGAAAESLGFPAGTRSLPELSDASLATLYGEAVALLLPSRYEGFGLPALEAMATGCPVIAASGSSLSEVVGRAGVLCDPDDEQAWIAAAEALIRDPSQRESLGSLALERAGHFTWSECARRSLAAYRRALEK